MKAEPFLYGLDPKIDKFYKYCCTFIDSDSNNKKKIAELSIFPTFLFHGYPGTGKSSAASLIYSKLKEEHNIDLKRLRIDELISYNFGESSKNLIKYFEEIDSDIKKNTSRCLVIMDEIDSFTTNRYQNDNESIRRVLLTFNTIIDERVRTGDIKNYIIIATTNMIDNIDTSVLRRFCFHEDFNNNLDSNEFEIYFNELLKLTESSTLDSGAINDIYMLYCEKRYTLGEVKSIFAHSFFDSIALRKSKNLDIDNFIESFKNKKTFYEIANQQIKGDKSVN